MKQTRFGHSNFSGTKGPKIENAFNIGTEEKSFFRLILRVCEDDEEKSRNSGRA